MKVNKLLNNTELVIDILTKHKGTRNDDNLLYEYVLNKYNISVNTSIREIHNMVKQKTIPSSYTIERCRRKVQELYPQLCSYGKMAKIRNQEQDKYKEFNKIM